jgi:hypothetical protein
MRQRLVSLGATRLPRGWRDLVGQLALIAGACGGYELVRSLVGGGGEKPFDDANRIIHVERTLRVFYEPSIEQWAESHGHWLLGVADWTYLDAHFVVTVGALTFIYLRRNDSFHLVRNTLMVAMAIALVGYAVYPTAPPWLMPQWGFSDAIRQFTGLTIGSGPGGALLNVYAAVPSMHVCFALIVGLPMSRLVQGTAPRMLWRLYPLYIAFVVVVTGNHYFTDVLLGALTAALAFGLASHPIRAAAVLASERS